MNNLIESEIIRFKLYYNILDKLKDVLNNILNEKEIKHLLLRYILNRNIFNTSKNNIGDPLFIILKNDNTIADKQLKEDFEYFKINNTEIQKKVHNIIKTEIKNSADYLKNTIITYKDKNVKIKKKNNFYIFEYNSPSLDNIKDNYISIYNSTISIPYYSHIDFKQLDIKYVFCTIFRYKYIFIDAHSSALDYSEFNPDDAIECFSTPFNRHHTLYCSAFPDLETKLGSLGNFFTIEKFPLKNLFINPVYDNTIMHLSIVRALELLDKYEHNITFTMPDWPDAEYYNLLYNSKYFKKKVHFKRGELVFTNYFTGKTYSPCANIQVYLSSINT